MPHCKVIWVLFASMETDRENAQTSRTHTHAVRLKLTDFQAFLIFNFHFDKSDSILFYFIGLFVCLLICFKNCVFIDFGPRSLIKILKLHDSISTNSRRKYLRGLQLVRFFLQSKVHKHYNDIANISFSIHYLQLRKFFFEELKSINVPLFIFLPSSILSVCVCANERIFIRFNMK